MVLPSGGTDPSSSRKARERTGNDHPRGSSVNDEALLAGAAGSLHRPADRPAPGQEALRVDD